MQRRLRVLRGAARFAMAATVGPPALLGVGWAITYRCNARCPFCSRHSGPEGVSTAEALRIVDQLGALGCLRVHLTGGEPLVRSDLPEILDRIGRTGMRRSINTNGILLTRRPEVVERCDVFVVSVDGPEEVHDGYRGSGSFGRMMEGAQMLHDRGARFAFSVALFSKNLEHLDFFVDLARRFDTMLIVQPGATHVIGSTDPNPETPELTAYRRAIRSLREDPARRRYVWNSTPALRCLERFPESPGLRCHAGRITCRLEVDGRLYPCSRTILDARCGSAPNVLELGVAEAFRRLPRIDCEGTQCWAAHNVEKNLLFGLHPASAWNLLTRNYASPRRWR